MTDISVFAVDPNTCQLSQIAGSPFSTGVKGGASALSYSPSGTCLAVTTPYNGRDLSQPGIISVFSVKNCIPTLVANNNAGGFITTSATFSQKGHCFVAANSFSDTLTTFSVSKCCQLTPSGLLPVLNDRSPYHLAANDTCIVSLEINPDGSFTLSSYKFGCCSGAAPDFSNPAKSTQGLARAILKPAEQLKKLIALKKEKRNKSSNCSHVISGHRVTPMPFSVWCIRICITVNPDSFIAFITQSIILRDMLYTV